MGRDESVGKEVGIWSAGCPSRRLTHLALGCFSWTSGYDSIVYNRLLQPDRRLATRVMPV